MRFPTKVDRSIGVALVFGPAVTVFSAIVATTAGQPLVGLIPLAVIALVYGGLVIPVYYELADEVLVIRFGMARVRVPYRDIRGVEPTDSILSAPALSMDRIRIDYGRDSEAVISPADRDGFLTALAAKVPHLRRDGERLVAAG